MPPEADGSPAERAGTDPQIITPADVGESEPALVPPQSDTAPSGEPLRRRRRRRRRRPLETGADAAATADVPAAASPSPGDTAPEVAVAQTARSGAGEPNEQRPRRRRRRRRPPQPGTAAAEGPAMPTSDESAPPDALDDAAPGATESDRTLHLRLPQRQTANAHEAAADAPADEAGGLSAARAPRQAERDKQTAPGVGTLRRRRRRRPPAISAAANGTSVPDAPSGAEPRPSRGPRPRRPRSERAGGLARPGAAAGPPRERSATDRREPASRDRGARRAGPSGSQRRASDRRRGRDAPPNRPPQKLYTLESMVDRGFEDVADETTENATRRVHWTILKRSIADQNSGKPMSTAYVLQREGAETEFANLGAARAAANKTIIHPEKLTLSKAEHAAAKTK